MNFEIFALENSIEGYLTSKLDRELPQAANTNWSSFVSNRLTAVQPVDGDAPYSC